MLFAGGLAIGCGIWLLLRGGQSASPVPQPPSRLSAPVVETPPPAAVEPPSEVRDGALAGAGEAGKQEAQPEAGDGEAPLEHALRSVIEANQDELKLEPSEVARLAAHYLEFQEVHSELASRFVQETRFDPTSVTLRVPAFPVEGQALRELFYSRIRAALPPEKYERVASQLGQYFETAFQGFGAAEQTIEVTRSADVPDVFDVRWEAKVPEGQVPDTGMADVQFAGTSGHLRMSREQVSTGEFRYLGPVIEARFPN